MFRCESIGTSKSWCFGGPTVSISVFLVRFFLFTKISRFRYVKSHQDTGALRYLYLAAFWVSVVCVTIKETIKHQGRRLQVDVTEQEERSGGRCVAGAKASGMDGEAQPNCQAIVGLRFDIPLQSKSSYSKIII